KIDVLLQFETQAEQDALLENAWLHLRMTHRAEENRLELAQFIYRAIGQHFTGLQVAIAAEVVIVPVELETEFLAGRLAHLERFASAFRACTVAADDCNIVTFHKSYFPTPQKPRGGSGDANVFPCTGNGILTSKR